MYFIMNSKILFLGHGMSTSFWMCNVVDIYIDLYSKCNITPSCSEAFRTDMYTNDDTIFWCSISITDACAKSS